MKKMKEIAHYLYMFIFLFFIEGCGQKGALIMPDQNSQLNSQLSIITQIGISSS